MADLFQPSVAGKSFQTAQTPSQPISPGLSAQLSTQPAPGASPAAGAGQGVAAPTTAKVSAEDFANAIKAKYPQYQNIDNQTLAKQVIAKYPQYSYQVDASSFTSPAPYSTGFAGAINKIGSTMGNVGMGILKGTAKTITGGESLIQGGLNAVTQPLEKLTNQGYSQQTATANQVFGPALTDKGTAQKVGDVAAQIGQFFIPGDAEEDAVEGIGKIGKGLGWTDKTIDAAKLGVKALTSAGIMSGISSVQQGSLKGALGQGIVGAGISLLSAPVAALIDKIPETAWSSILKRTPAVVVKDPDLEEEAAKTGLMGVSRQSILDKAGAEITNIEQAIDAIVKDAKGDIPISKIKSYVQPLIDAYNRIPGEESSVKAIQGVLDSLDEKQGETISVQDAQQLKKDIYQHIAKSYGKGLMEISPDTEAQKQIARGLKTELENLIPEIHDLNQQHAVYNGIQEALDRTIARGTGKGIAGTGVGLYDLLTAGIGEVAGGPWVALGASAGKKALESPAVLSGISAAINYFNDLSPTARMMFYNGLKGVISQGIKGLSSSATPPPAATPSSAVPPASPK